ncbi:MAG: deoxyribodipyrimidine photo-lyase [Methanolobus sp.]|nr:deoxyribodipyrimidine photo-lyase [Methanolobus sp.]
MSSRFKRSLFIFRRDLRIDDNTALLSALEMSDEVLPS